MYLIQVGPQVYGKRDGSTFTLPEALTEVYGVGHASVLRADGTVAVRHAGSAYEVAHVTRDGRERIVRRRPVVHRCDCGTRIVRWRDGTVTEPGNPCTPHICQGTCSRCGQPVEGIPGAWWTVTGGEGQCLDVDGEHVAVVRVARDLAGALA